MTITAKYPSRCASCSGVIVAGEKIEWVKSSPARHTACQISPTPIPARPKGAAPAYRRRTADLGQSGYQHGVYVLGDDD